MYMIMGSAICGWTMLIPILFFTLTPAWFRVKKLRVKELPRKRLQPKLNVSMEQRPDVSLSGCQACSLQSSTHEHYLAPPICSLMSGVMGVVSAGSTSWAQWR
eukprot:TRINITY_DN64356_c0_g1_i1.p1 TRINITY_DN64356_c0_g1~~TRINITY_DN64356_c0_g1_i1.p1  ORF type:complete len:103 (-),score=4.64 TRINITY_DN64356_c0_g1_i1:77-385(-)